MAIANLFGRKSVSQTKVTESKDQNDLKTIVFFMNGILKKKSPIPLKFQGWSANNQRLLYEGDYNGGKVYIEIDKNSQNGDVDIFVNDIFRQIDYAFDTVTNFYEGNSDVTFKHFYRGETHHNHIVLVIDGEELDIVYHCNVGNVMKGVNDALITKRTFIEGKLDGRQNDVLIDGIDVIAFLRHLKSKGKTIRIEVLDKTE